MKNIFISFSKEQEEFAQKIAGTLSEFNPWVYLTRVNGGDDIFEKVGTALEKTNIFIVILSKESIESEWVKNELRVAFSQKISGQTSKIIPVLWENTIQAPTFLKGISYIKAFESAEHALQEILSSVKDENFISRKRNFVNRYSEIGLLQDWILDPDLSIISIYGMSGIGKETLIFEAIKRVWDRIPVNKIELTSNNIGAGLTISLCAKAEIDIPVDTIGEEERKELNKLAVEKILSSNQLLFFSDFESILNDDGTPSTEIQLIIDHYSTLPTSKSYPLFITSRRKPNLSILNRKIYQELPLRAMQEQNIIQLLRIELEIYPLPNEEITSEKLQRIASYLHGYPLATRYIPSIIAQKGIDFFLETPKSIEKLKIDIAKTILSKLSLSPEEIKILEILAIIAEPISPTELKEATQEISEVDFFEKLDHMFEMNLLESEGNKLTIHPLLIDHFTNIIRDDDQYISIINRLKEISLSRLKKMEHQGSKYVNLLKRTVRLYFYAGDLQGGRQVRRDLIGELGLAVVELYRRGNYDSALTFADEYLSEYPNDKKILFHKARILSRLKRPEESIAILRDLISTAYSDKIRAKNWQAIGRAYLENASSNENEFWDLAENAFNKSLSLNEHHSALRDLGDLYTRKGDSAEREGDLSRKKTCYEEASGFFVKALDIAPGEPYIHSMYSDVLWQLGKKIEAVNSLETALRYIPGDATIIFRVGRFYHETGKETGNKKFIEKAITFFERAHSNSSRFIDPLLSLISANLDIGRESNLQKVETLLSTIKFCPEDKRHVLSGIKIDFYLKTNNITKADEELSRFWNGGITAEEYVRKAAVLSFKSKKAFQEGYSSLGQSYSKQARELCEEGLLNFSGNPYLLRQLDSLQ